MESFYEWKLNDFITSACIYKVFFFKKSTWNSSLGSMDNSNRFPSALSRCFYISTSILLVLFPRIHLRRMNKSYWNHMSLPWFRISGPELSWYLETQVYGKPSSPNYVLCEIRLSVAHTQRYQFDKISTNSEWFTNKEDCIKYVCWRQLQLKYGAHQHLH